MTRRRAHALPQVDLFPFLSVLLCVVGVLSVLIVAPLLAAPKVSLTLSRPDAPRATYVIECHPQRMVLRPPAGAGNKAPGARKSLDIAWSREVKAALKAAFDEVRQHNRGVAMKDQSEQRAVVVAVYPGSDGCYDAVASVLRSPAGLGIEFGAEPLLAEMVVVDEVQR